MTLLSTEAVALILLLGAQVIAELERMHSHLLWLGVAAHEVGFNTLFMWTWRDREIVQDLLELSRLEAHGGEAEHVPVDVGGMLALIRKDALALPTRFLPKYAHLDYRHWVDEGGTDDL